MKPFGLSGNVSFPLFRELNVANLQISSKALQYFEVNEIEQEAV